MGMALSTSPKKPKYPWYYVTRAIGAFMVLYGMLGDHSPDRGTIIITGTGLLGLDKVARSGSGGDKKE
jgi:hypothetical protein